MSRLETEQSTWFLEVVRGRDIGRRFPVPASSVLGAGAGSGIDLGGQETGPLKRMAPRQARLELRPSGLAIADLDSPGGTFVNRKRLLSGTEQPLNEGDVIQVGGVQVRVVLGNGPAPKPTPAPGFVYTLPTGETCRTFDDVLTLSAQRWSVLRDELLSGRLAAQLARSGRADLAPDPDAAGSPDERLDAWLRSLPSVKPCRPELDVHPTKLVVRNTSGGTTRRPVRITNTGYGLLTYRASTDQPWLRVANHAEQSVVEASECVLEIDLPDGPSVRKTATCLVESDGGEARVSVEVGPAVSGDGPIQEHQNNLGHDVGSLAFSDWPFSKRVGTLVPFLLLARLVAGLSTWLLVPAGEAAMPLWPSSAVFSGLGLVLGLWWTRRGFSVSDRLAVGVSAAVGGLLASAVVVALARTLEAPLPGSGLAFWGLVAAEWLALGVAVLVGSMWLAPARECGP